MITELDIAIWVLTAVGSYITLVWLLAYYKGKNNISQNYSKLKNLPFVSIAIPAYNEEENIENAIKSLINSDYPKDKLEIIVVNDGSTDNTGKIFQKYVKLNFMKLINQHNKGKGAALNTALKQAKGRLFGVMDADTIIEKDAITKMVTSFDLKNRNLGAMISAIKPLKADNILEKFQQIEYILSICARKLLELMESNYVTPGALSIYNKNTIKKIGGFNEHNITEDLEIALRLRLHGYDIKASLDAVSYTIVPKKFGQFFTQRLRWIRGFLQNSWKYKSILFNPKYKTLGLYQLPIALITTFVIIPLSLLMTFYSLYEVFYDAYLYFAAVGFNLPIFELPGSLELLFLSFNLKMYFPLIVTMILALTLARISFKLANETYKNILFTVPTIMFYYPILATISIIAIISETLKIKTKW